jgi:DNA-binding MarR family transcriptional regulator
MKYYKVTSGVAGGPDEIILSELGLKKTALVALSRLHKFNLNYDDVLCLEYLYYNGPQYIEREVGIRIFATEFAKYNTSIHILSRLRDIELIPNEEREDLNDRCRKYRITDKGKEIVLAVIEERQALLSRIESQRDRK